MKNCIKGISVILLTFCSIVLVAYLSMNINLPKIEKNESEIEVWILS